MAKYADHYRMFMAPDGNVQHVAILHPRYVEAFVMLSIDLHSSRGVSFFHQFIIMGLQQCALHVTVSFNQIM